MWIGSIGFHPSAYKAVFALLIHSSKNVFFCFFCIYEGIVTFVVQNTVRRNARSLPIRTKQICFGQMLETCPQVIPSSYMSAGSPCLLCTMYAQSSSNARRLSSDCSCYSDSAFYGSAWKEMMARGNESFSETSPTSEGTEGRRIDSGNIRQRQRYVRAARNVSEDTSLRHFSHTHRPPSDTIYHYGRMCMAAAWSGH